MKPMGAIIGAVMRATRGQADAKAVTKIVMGKIVTFRRLPNVA